MRPVARPWRTQPLSVQLTDGTTLAPFQLAKKPNDVEAPAARLPLYAA